MCTWLAGSEMAELSIGRRDKTPALCSEQPEEGSARKATKHQARERWWPQPVVHGHIERDCKATQADATVQEKKHR